LRVDLALDEYLVEDDGQCVGLFEEKIDVHSRINLSELALDVLLEVLVGAVVLREDLVGSVHQFGDLYL
jgi:hypothetical protein